MILPILLRRPYLLPLHDYGYLQQTPTTTSPMLLCPLVPIHKLPDGSSSLPWQTSRHLHYFVGKDALLHLVRWMLSLPSSPQTSKRILCPYKPSPCCHLQCNQLLTYRIHHSSSTFPSSPAIPSLVLNTVLRKVLFSSFNTFLFFI